MARVEISEEPLRQLFGSVTAYHTLMYIAACGRGYAGEIARAHEHALAPVQRQLRKFESVGLLVSTDLVESTLNVAGILAMVVGAAAFAAGVFLLARDRI